MGCLLTGGAVWLECTFVGVYRVYIEGCEEKRVVVEMVREW